MRMPIATRDLISRSLTVSSSAPSRGLYVDRNIAHNGARELREKYPEDLRCFTLDRSAFERDGRAWCPSRAETYYATEAQAIDH